jgi:hypothetical protein
MVEDERALAEATALRHRAGVVAVHRFNFKRMVADVVGDDYGRLSAAQQAGPILLTEWEGTFVWWYLDRFWWDSEGLTSEDVRALVSQRDRRTRAKLERAHDELRRFEDGG